MRSLIRYIISTDGVTEYRDEKSFVGALTIGRSIKSTITLPGKNVSLQHAQIIQKRDKSFLLKNSSTGNALLNGEKVVNASLNVNDVITIGQHKIKRINCPPGFDLALEIEKANIIDELVATEYQYKDSLEKTGLSKRKWSWAFGLTFLLFGLILPWSLSTFSLEYGYVKFASSFADKLWQSGPLDEAHESILGYKCKVCHEKPFQTVRDTACDECHQTMTHHTNLENDVGKSLADIRCASCHKEHNEPATIIRQDQEFCADCHDELKDRVDNKTDLIDVSDFGKDHPKFKLTTLVPETIDGSLKWTLQRKLAGNLKEQSNLEFSHVEHFDPDGVDTPDGSRIMKCQDCHEVDALGVSMKPINMIDHCEECHKLTFDKRAGDILLPHGNVGQAYLMIEGFFKGEYKSDYQPVTSQVNKSRQRRTRVPGRRQEERESPASSPEQRVERAARDVFERTTCGICHDVTKNEALRIKWVVEPVLINQDWMPKAYFSHSSHTMKKCQFCHKADKSELSSDVLMPDIKICRECHTGQNSKEDILESTCILCHRFHISENPAMYANIPTKSKSSIGQASGQNVDR